MTDKHVDKAKGRVKEAAGALTGDRHLKNEGRADQAKGSAKNAVDKITDLLLSAWAFCLPSTYEGLGLPYLEAMSCGTAVVASPNPGAEDLLRPASSGLVVEDDSLGSTLVSVIRSDDIRRRLSEAGRRRADDFTWDRVGAEYERAYALAIQRWGQRSARP